MSLQEEIPISLSCQAVPVHSAQFMPEVHMLSLVVNTGSNQMLFYVYRMYQYIASVSLWYGYTS